MEKGKHICPVCGKYEFYEYDSLDECEVCGWVDMAFQERHPDEDALQNMMSLNQAKKAYAEGRRVN